MVQVSIDNERDFDRVADALIIQHPRIYLREVGNARREKAKDTNWFQETGKHIGIGKSGASTYHANFTSVEDCDHGDDTVELADAFQAHNDPPDPGSDVGEEALDCDDDEENDKFSPFVALDDVSVLEAAELVAIALLTDTWDNDLDPEVSAQLVQTNVQAYLSFEKEKGKGKGEGKGKFPVRPSCLPLEDRRQRLRELKAKTECRACGRKDIGRTIANAQCAHPVCLQKPRRVQLV